MSKEEAIKYLKEMKDECNDTFHMVRYVTQEEALEMAIKALEQEPCEDAVSRKEVINQIFYSTDNNGDVVLGSALRERIARLPSVKQEPKTEYPQKSCDTCEYSDEMDGSNCYECVKDMRKNYSPKELKTDYIAHGTDGNFYKLIISNGKEFKQDPSGDLISRQELLEDLYKRDYTKFTHRDFVALVQYQDTVQQEPKTGHWSHDGSHWKNRFFCSECGYKLFDEPTNYCPNCGARMVAYRKVRG